MFPTTNDDLCFAVLVCGICRRRVTEWFPYVQDFELPTAPRCADHGGPLPVPLFPDPPLDRKGNPLPQWLLLRRAIKKKRTLGIVSTVTLKL